MSKPIKRLTEASDDYQPSFVFGVVLLAAGASSRMGQPKLLLPWGNTSVLGHQLQLWQKLGAKQIGVVCPPKPHTVHAELDRLQGSRIERITNERPERGMFSSIQCAASWDGWVPELTHWALVLGDQPHVPLEVLRRLLEFAIKHPDRVCQPAREGRARHPLLMPVAVFAELRGSTAETLKHFLWRRQQPSILCELNHPSLDLDLDTPADYERALRDFGPRSA
jgi:molybdenum cofactor cytidylyltransferase